MYLNKRGREDSLNVIDAGCMLARAHMDFPMCNQTWLAGKSSIWLGDFPSDRISMKGFSQLATVDYRRVSELVCVTIV